MKEKESTVLKAFITGAWTLITGQALITLVREYFIMYWNCALLDYFAYVVLSITLGKDTFKDSPQATNPLQQ